MNGTYMSILKVHGSGIKLRHLDNLPCGMCKTNSFRIFAHNLDNRDGQSESGIQVFVLDELGSSCSNQSKFSSQKYPGQFVFPTDLVLFMTQPADITRKAAYAFEISVSHNNTSLEDLNCDEYKKVGTAYFYLEPKFSTQGVQRMQVMGAHSSAPIGSLQVEYLVVKDPVAYGVEVPIPDWISKSQQLDAGHRGAGSGCRADLPGDITENTVASFNYAARHGADMCELDVMCTSDGIPVVYHNYILSSTANGPNQVDQFTLDELRSLKNTLHDKDCRHKSDGSDLNRTKGCSAQFPTLEEVLRDVDQRCALNIELKWPQLLPNGQSEAMHYREINDFVDRILNCIYQHENGRPIVLSTLNADIAIMLRMKQTRYPVLFLTTGDCKRFDDPATKTTMNAINFARAFDMAGINPNAAHLDEYLVKYAKERGLLIYAWGKIDSPQRIKELRSYGLDGLIYDKIDLIKPQD